MRIAVDLERDERVTHITDKMLVLLDDLKRVSCPKCGRPNLQPRISHNAMAIICTTPTYRDTEFEGDFEQCGYYHLSHITDVNSGVFALEFKEPHPKPKPRRTAAPKARGKARVRRKAAA